MITPGVVTSLAPAEVFVFGSNAQGIHAAGAARTAFELFGAVWGVGEGPTGQSYALPTMGGWEQFEDAAERFIDYATAHPNITFLLTPVGCGIAGYTPQQVAPLFFDAPANVALPTDFARLRAERTTP